MVAHLAEDPDGALWIGYRDAYGISRLTFSANRIQASHVTAATGLSSDKSLFLGFDARGRLWAGTDHGVDVFEHLAWRHQLEAQNWPVADHADLHGQILALCGQLATGAMRRAGRRLKKSAIDKGTADDHP